MFGVLTCVGGLVGVVAGSLTASRLRRLTTDSDPLVCAFSQLAAAPFLYAGLMLSSRNLAAMWVSTPCLTYQLARLLKK